MQISVPLTALKQNFIFTLRKTHLILQKKKKNHASYSVKNKISGMYLKNTNLPKLVGLIFGRISAVGM